MKREKIAINFFGEKKEVFVDIVPKWYEGIGLMFKKKNYSKVLMFKFKNPTKMSIHSLFVFFPFVSLWLDSDYNVVEMKIVKPFRLDVSPTMKYKYLIEIPINSHNKKIVDFCRRVSDGNKERFI